MASEQHAGDPLADPAARATAGRSGRHHRPSSLREGVHARLEEMRFGSGVLLMVIAGMFLVVVVGGIVLALSGGSDTRSPQAGGPPVAAPTSASVRPTGRSPKPRVSSRRPKTSSSTMVGTTSPQPTARPTPSGPPTGWPPHNGHPNWHHTSPPPWWHHH